MSASRVESGRVELAREEPFVIHHRRVIITASSLNLSSVKTPPWAGTIVN